MGTITAIEGNTLHVKMLQSSACSGCHAAKLCQSSEVKEKEVDVRVDDSSAYATGEKVLLLGSIRQGLNATLWAYMLPIVVLVLVMAVCYACRLSDAVSALAALTSLAVYFFCLYLCREKLNRKFTFEVQKLG